MSLPFPKRFSLRMMLVCTFTMAVMLVIVVDCFRLQDAREDFEYTWASWSVKNIGVEEVVAASEIFMAAEKASPWISSKSAECKHVVRLQKLLADVDSPLSEVSPSWHQRQHDYVIDQLRRYSIVADDER